MDVVRRNNVRLANVWMDNYVQLYYEYTQKNEGEDVGDLTERKELRKRLGCKTFKWYLDNIYPSRFKPWDAISNGEIRSKSEASKCLNGPSDSNVKLEECHGHQGAQFWYYTKTGELRTKSDQCLDSTGKRDDPEDIQTMSCHGSKGNQWWEHTINNAIIHRYHNLCLEARMNEVVLTNCIDGKISQRWIAEKASTHPVIE